MLVPAIEACLSDNGLDYLFSEITGAYNTENEGGWGSPNPDTSAATTATLQIYPPDQSTFLNSDTPLPTIDLFPVFPKSDTQYIHGISGADVGLGNVTWQDGLTKFVYTVTVYATEYTAEYYFFNTFYLESLKIKIGSLRAACCEDDDEVYMCLTNGLQSICDNISLGNYDNAAYIYKELLRKSKTSI